MNFNIIVCGVGGQGVVSSSNVVALAAFKQGLDVMKYETRGMAQQGGTVVSHVRIGDDVKTPIIREGCADLLIAFEPLEAIRYLNLLNVEGKLLASTHPIKVLGYPKLGDLYGELESHGAELVDASILAKKAGGFIMQNTVMLGAASRHIPLDEKNILEAIRETFAKQVGVNLKAFEIGKNRK